MAGQSANSVNIERVSRAVSNTTNAIVHPEYQYWLPDWVKLRDTLAGQRVVKSKGEAYLPRNLGAEALEYKAYLDGAIFFNMVDQTLNGMTGQVFRRAPVIRNLPEKLQDKIIHLGQDGSSHVAFTKTVVREVCAMGRYGVLVDAPKTSGDSYAVGYRAEDILDWTIESIGGVQRLTRVLLREFKRVQSTLTGRAKVRSGGQTYQYETVYRELVLEFVDGRWTYFQNIYDKGGPQGVPTDIIRPVINGNPLTAIPFVFFGPTGNTPDCEKPPLIDIAELNLSHYEDYADFQHGKKYTSLPIYVVPGGSEGGADEYKIGPNTIWEVPINSKPEILEYKGDGLKTQANALSTKERQIAAIGGRLLPGMGQGISESSEQATMRGASEQSILLNVILSVQDGMSLVLRYWAAWRDVPMATTAQVRYVINSNFLVGHVDARVLRALQMLWEAGLVPIEVLFDNLRDLEVLSDDWTLEMFIERMQDPTAFVNNPDAQAKTRGYASRKQELDEAARKIEQGQQDRALDIQEESIDGLDDGDVLRKREDQQMDFERQQHEDQMQFQYDKLASDEALAKQKLATQKAIAAKAAQRPAVPAQQPSRPPAGGQT
ncbi:portal protein [Caulobacter phage C1]|nr:portal protein [Caulobacter phage C1]UTU08300.1 portal protein [Caulobacter phage C2]UTU08823.1 portal protein [Caulobacter phage J4]UTU09375.1 portal protein [Caulobacter phage BL47]UTU09935.1 portal protein [Caulobacter phage RB23]WGN96960.1 portal protein [Bertelyvirus sp.]